MEGEESEKKQVVALSEEIRDILIKKKIELNVGVNALFSVMANGCKFSLKMSRAQFREHVQLLLNAACDIWYDDEWRLA